MEDKTKLTSYYQRFIVAMSERRKIGLKNWLKKISLNTAILLTLFVGILTIVYMGYYDVLATRPERVLTTNSVKILFYVPYITVLATSIILLSPNKVFKLMHIFIPIVILFFSILYFVQNEVIIIILTALLGVLFGEITVGAIYIFLFNLNSSEQFIAVMAFTVAICGLSLLNYVLAVINLPVIVIRYVIPMMILVISFVLLFLADKSDYEDIQFKEEILPTMTIVMIIAIIAIILINDGILLGIRQSMKANTYFNTVTYLIGFSISIILCFTTFIYAKNAIYMILIYYFISVIVTYEFGIFYQLFPYSPIIRHFFEALHGNTASLGVIGATMMVGKILEDKVSFKAFQIFALFLPMYILGSRFLAIAIKSLPMSKVLFFSIIFMTLIFIILLAFNFKAVLMVSSTKNTPVSQIEKNLSKYKQINPEEVLTKKEKIIFDLLIEGLTLRQIAGEISLKYDTVNFHYKNIYRKLEVNSKIELILRYGDTNK